MLKWLFLSLVVLVFWGLIRSRNKLTPPAEGPAPAASAMVACVQCRVYLPQAEAVIADGNVFCCQEHRDQWQRSH